MDDQTWAILRPLDRLEQLAALEQIRAAAGDDPAMQAAADIADHLCVMLDRIEQHMSRQAALLEGGEQLIAQFSQGGPMAMIGQLASVL